MKNVELKIAMVGSCIFFIFECFMVSIKSFGLVQIWDIHIVCAVVQLFVFIMSIKYLRDE